MNNQSHYDKITDAWTFILGQNLHYGYFTRSKETLAEATDALVDTMAALAPLDSNTLLLDVGCGIGAPAFRLSSRTGCKIAGISISARGVTMATEACLQKGLAQRVAFYQRDALDNGFPNCSFDVVWVMESSHLMRDKSLLCAENYRVLKPGGVMLLCDLILKHELSLADIYLLRSDLSTLAMSFGKAKMETFGFYETTMRSQGFVKISGRDISREVLPTLEQWKHNLECNRTRIAGNLSEKDIENFAKSCDILKKLFEQELLGYAIVSGMKEH